MPKFNKRTQILLSEKQYERLLREARARDTSMGSLIREAIDKSYSSDTEQKLEAVRKLSEMELPVSDWETMEEEIMTMYDECPPFKEKHED